MFSIVCSKNNVQIVFLNTYSLGCGTTLRIPAPLPNHAICIFSVEYTYPHTDKTAWLGMAGVGTYLYRTFPVFFMSGSKNKMLETNFRSNLILTAKKKKKKMNHNLINIDLRLQFIFYFWSFEIIVNSLKNQIQMIGLDSYSRQVFNYLDPILIYISL